MYRWWMVQGWTTHITPTHTHVHRARTHTWEDMRAHKSTGMLRTHVRTGVPKHSQHQKHKRTQRNTAALCEAGTSSAVQPNSTNSMPRRRATSGLLVRKMATTGSKHSHDTHQVKKKTAAHTTAKHNNKRRLLNAHGIARVYDHQHHAANSARESGHSHDKSTFPTKADTHLLRTSWQPMWQQQPQQGSL